MQKNILQVFAVLALTTAILSFFWPTFIWVFVLILPAGIIAVLDINQTEHALRRNFPLIGRARWLAEFIRLFIRQYFIESDIDGAPLNRMSRSIVYQRAKGDIDTIPYGTKLDVYQDGYEWLGHSLQAIDTSEIDQGPRVVVGGPDCKLFGPYGGGISDQFCLKFKI